MCMLRHCLSQWKTNRASKSKKNTPRKRSRRREMHCGSSPPSPVWLKLQAWTCVSFTWKWLAFDRSGSHLQTVWADKWLQNLFCLNRIKEVLGDLASSAAFACMGWSLNVMAVCCLHNVFLSQMMIAYILVMGNLLDLLMIQTCLCGMCVIGLATLYIQSFRRYLKHKSRLIFNFTQSYNAIHSIK